MYTEQEFTLALMRLADTITQESNGSYHAVDFRMLVDRMGGVEAARFLINQPVSEGFLRLEKMGRPDLSLESLIAREPKFQALFTECELAICRRRARALAQISS